MKIRNHTTSNFQLLSSASIAALTALTAPSVALAQGDGADNRRDTVVVTATRRAESVQEIPLNIAAVDGDQIETQGFTELADLLPYVPGINIVDRGGRQGNPIIVRGLNVDPIGPGDGNNDGGGTVATYIGEIPVYVDLKLNDLERVEVLLGPQGTLYGAGTLGGAIRYIPRKPSFAEDSFELRAEGSRYSEAESFSADVGFTVNKALSDSFALRGSFDYTHDSGFIDYVGVVQQPGVSNADVDLTDSAAVAANLRTIEDADGEDTYSGRIAARWQPTDWFDGTFTYYRQEANIEGRRVSHHRDLFMTGRYESGFRVEEPNEIKNELYALELTADLGFAELTSASGFSKFKDDGQRDQTTLLITLEYSYELFPSFTAFTHELGREERFNQELRLVSTHEGPLNWIIGGFYNDFKSHGSSAEFTPNYDTYAIDVLGFDFLVDRPDDLEYFSTGRTGLVEKAVFGEIGYTIADRLTLTGGGRYYDYDLQAASTVDFPLFDLGFMPATLDEIAKLEFDPDLAQSDSGFLYKANLSYQATDDLLLYATVSEGYRIGGSNGIGQCEDFDPDDPATQGACALAPGQVFFPGGPENISDRDERQFFADQTTNYELGLKSTLADGAVIFNAAVYYVDWTDPQVSSSTVNANIPITVNGDGAASKGVELSGAWFPTDRLELRGNFSYVNSELTADVPDLIRIITPPGFSSAFEDGKDGDRLPGSPETQFSFFGAYTHPLANQSSVAFNMGYSYQGDVLTRAGARGSSYTLPGFGVANMSLVYDNEDWSATFFVNNVFNKFAETGAIGTLANIQTVVDNNGDTVYPRAFSTHILPPRSIGLRFNYKFSKDR